MSLQTRLSALVTAIGADVKYLRSKVDLVMAKTTLDGGAHPTAAYDSPPPGDGVYASPTHSHDYAVTLHAHDYAAPGHIHDFAQNAGMAADSALLDGLDSTAFARMNRYDLIGWGQMENHGTHVSFDTINRFGVSYVQGAGNAPPIVGGMDQFYVVTQSLGAEYPFSQYAMQIAYKRGAPASFATRFREGGAWSGWTVTGGDTPWYELEPASGWSKYQTGLGQAWTPRYRKKNGIVYLEGLFNGGPTGTAAFLPAGFRPGSGTSMRIQMIAGSTLQRMDINGDGSIYFGEGGSTTGWHSIATSFIAEN